MISDSMRRQWAAKAANMPKTALIRFIVKLGKERDFHRVEARQWRDIALGKGKFDPNEFETHLQDGNEVPS